MKTVFIILSILGLVIVCAFAYAEKPPSHPIVVREALERLLQRPTGAYLIIEDVKSGKFVQFSGSIDEPLLLDLPSQTLSSGEMMQAKALFTKLGYPGPETYQLQKYPGGLPAGEQTSFMVNFGKDIENATELTLIVFHQVYGLEHNAKLNIIEG